MDTHHHKKVARFYNRSSFIYDLIFRIPYHRGRKTVAKLCKETDEVLDFGCNAGQMGTYLQSQPKNYTGVDVSQKAILQAIQRLPDATFVNENIETVKLNKAFDVVILNHVISVTHSPTNLISNCYKHLKKGGLLIINNTYSNGSVNRVIDDKLNGKVFLGTKFYNPKPEPETLKGFKFEKEIRSNLLSKCLVYEKI